jgi:hypothetical protein
VILKRQIRITTENERQEICSFILGRVKHRGRGTVLVYTGSFTMFSVNTDIYNKKTKGHALMQLFTAAGKLEKILFLTTRDVRCVHPG